MKLRTLSQKEILSTFPFRVEEIEFANPDGSKLDHPYHRLLCPDWVNILPIDTEGQALLIHQFRAGAMTTILETPGGVLDHTDADPATAAKRELEEETGYRSDNIIYLASINPNPAIQNNTLHCFLALDCYLPKEREHFPDKYEDLVIEKVPMDKLDQLISQRQLDHALSVLTILFAKPMLKLPAIPHNSPPEVMLQKADEKSYK